MPEVMRWQRSSLVSLGNCTKAFADLALELLKDCGMILKPAIPDSQRQTFVGTDFATELPSSQQSQAGQQDGLCGKDASRNPGERRWHRLGLRSA
jgi:hypothetical protein